MLTVCFSGLAKQTSYEKFAFGIEMENEQSIKFKVNAILIYKIVYLCFLLQKLSSNGTKLLPSCQLNFKVEFDKKKKVGSLWQSENLCLHLIRIKD